MASIQKRLNGSWLARYRPVPGGPQVTKTFARKVDGQRWLDAQVAGLVRGDHVDHRDGRTLLREHAARWQASQVSREGTARIADNALRLHILPALGDRTVASLRRSDVQGLVKRLTTGTAERRALAPGSVRNVYDVLSSVLGAAVEDRIIAASPCIRIVLPRLDEVEVVPPSVADVIASADAVQPRYRALVVLLAGSGLRIGEALGLRVGDVDFLRRTVRVERQRLQSGDIGPTKTAKSTRTVPLGQVVIGELASHTSPSTRRPWICSRPSWGSR